MRKVLTGGTGDGTESCGANTALYKKFSDNRDYTPLTAPTVSSSRSTTESGCSGTLVVA